VRAGAWPWIRAAALLMNGLLLAAGLWVELRPRYRVDAWTGGALVALAAVNAAALLIAGGSPSAARLRRRVQRIALFTNVLLMAVAVAFASGSLHAAGGGSLESAAPFALMVPPLLSGVAILLSRRDAG